MIKVYDIKFNNSSCVYVIYNNINNFRYIGSTINIGNRVAGHKFDYKRSTCNKGLSDFVDKYGWDFVFVDILELIEDITQSVKLENKWINKYDFNTLWNISPIAGSNLGVKMPDSHVEKSRERMLGNTITKGMKLPKEHSENIRKFWKDNPERLTEMKKKNRLSQLKVNRSNIKQGKIIEVYKDGILLEEVMTLKRVCEKYNLTHSCASKVLQGKQRATKGYVLIDKGYFFEK